MPRKPGKRSANEAPELNHATIRSAWSGSTCLVMLTVTDEVGESGTALTLRWTCKTSESANNEVSDVCRNIRQLHNFDPPATDEEVRAAALQYVLKIGGGSAPSQANRPAYDRAARQIATATAQLLEELTARGQPRNREVEAAKARARSAARYGRVS